MKDGDRLELNRSLFISRRTFESHRWALLGSSAVLTRSSSKTSFLWETLREWDTKILLGVARFIFASSRTDGSLVLLPCFCAELLFSCTFEGRICFFVRFIKSPRQLDRVLSFLFSFRFASVYPVCSTRQKSLERNEQLKQRGNDESYRRKLNAKGEKRVAQRSWKGERCRNPLVNNPWGGNDLLWIISFIVLSEIYVKLFSRDWTKFKFFQKFLLYVIHIYDARTREIYGPRVSHFYFMIFPRKWAGESDYESGEKKRRNDEEKEIRIMGMQTRLQWDHLH